MIDWNEVTVGETEIVADGYDPRKIICVRDEWVWMQYKDHTPTTVHKDDLDKWTIYDPWEEITNDIIFKRSFMRNMEAVQHLTFRCYAMSFNDAVIDPDDPNFKVDGRRVWKRKEGAT